MASRTKPVEDCFDVVHLQHTAYSKSKPTGWKGSFFTVCLSTVIGRASHRGAVITCMRCMLTMRRP